MVMPAASARLALEAELDWAGRLNSLFNEAGATNERDWPFEQTYSSPGSGSGRNSAAPGPQQTMVLAVVRGLVADTERARSQSSYQ